MNIFSLYYSLAAGYAVVAVFSILITLAGIVFSIYSGIKMIQEENQTLGIITLILGIIGIFIPICMWVALIISAIEYFRDDDKQKGWIAAGLVIVGLIFGIVTFVGVLHSTTKAAQKILEQSDKYSKNLTESYTDDWNWSGR